MDELLEFKKQMGDPSSTVIIAPHGFQWWSGYFLDVPVRYSMNDEVFQRYRHVLLLKVTELHRPQPLFPPQIPEPFRNPSKNLYKGQFVEFYEMSPR